MAKVKNISDGPRGAYNEGVLIFADPGQVIHTDEDINAEWFEEVGTPADGPKPLAGLNKAELLEVAADEGVEVEDGATNSAIREAIEAGRAAA